MPPKQYRKISHKVALYCISVRLHQVVKGMMQKRDFELCIYLVCSPDLQFAQRQFAKVADQSIELPCGGLDRTSKSEGRLVASLHSYP